MEELTNNLSWTMKNDIKRFKKEAGKTKLPLFSYIDDNEIVKCQFRDGGRWHNVNQTEPMFIDPERNRKVLRKDDSSFSEINIIFSDWGKILISYKLTNEDEMKYCSWGYKKHSATSEKMFAYFTTPTYTYMVYVDEQHPEYFFLLCDDGKSIEGLFNLLKGIMRGELK